MRTKLSMVVPNRQASQMLSEALGAIRQSGYRRVLLVEVEPDDTAYTPDQLAARLLEGAKVVGGIAVRKREGWYDLYTDLTHKPLQQIIYEYVIEAWRLPATLLRMGVALPDGGSALVILAIPPETVQAVRVDVEGPARYVTDVVTKQIAAYLKQWGLEDEDEGGE